MLLNLHKINMDLGITKIFFFNFCKYFRFIQQKLERASLKEKQMIFDEVVIHAHNLMTDVFGNYVRIYRFYRFDFELFRSYKSFSNMVLRIKRNNLQMQSKGTYSIWLCKCTVVALFKRLWNLLIRFNKLKS